MERKISGKIIWKSTSLFAAFCDIRKDAMANIGHDHQYAYCVWINTFGIMKPSWLRYQKAFLCRHQLNNFRFFLNKSECRELDYGKYTVGI
jgi:hypothetical protein